MGGGGVGGWKVNDIDQIDDTGRVVVVEVEGGQREARKERGKEGVDAAAAAIATAVAATAAVSARHA
jgi:hypothetical protein